MDWMMTPTVYKFSSESQYAEWVLSRADLVLAPGEVFILRFDAENRSWVKIGDGRTKLIDLPNIQ